jgi:hypothetical protein
VRHTYAARRFHLHWTQNVMVMRGKAVGADATSEIGGGEAIVIVKIVNGVVFKCASELHRLDLGVGSWRWFDIGRREITNRLQLGIVGTNLHDFVVNYYCPSFCLPFFDRIGTNLRYKIFFLLLFFWSKYVV